jgi:hypothetical protein
MKPTEKNKNIDDLLNSLLGKDRKGTILKEVCMTCDAENVPANLRNMISKMEYQISGMCQKCQDEVFGKDE